VEDVVDARVRLRDGSSRYFMTWGRILDPVDPKGIERLIWSALGRFNLGGVPDSIDLCGSLQEAAQSEYFYEALLEIARESITFGPTHAEWVATKKERMVQGKEIWYLGASLPRFGPGDPESGAKKR